MDEDRSNSSSPSSSKHRDSSLIDFEEENQERAASIRSRGGKGKNAARSKGKDKEHNRFYIDEATETQSDENENVDSATGVTDEDESNDIDEDELDEGDIKVRQETMNEIHLFGLPIWKAALYKKSRSVTRAAFLALHSKPKQSRSLMANPGNILWFLLVGWWLGLMTVVHGIIMYIIPFGGKEYGRVLWELGWYMFWPFGRRVERIKLSQRGGDIEEQLVDGSQEAGRAGGIKSKEQRFNAKSAGVTATLIIMGMIGSFAPTIFYHTFGNSEILCEQNNENTFGMKHGKQYVSMGRCVQRPLHPVKDQFFLTTVRPFTYFCAAVLLGSYLVALWFALNTHAAHIYSQNISINDRVEGLWRTLKRLVQLNAKENSPIHLGLTDSEFGSQTKQRVTFSSAEPHSHISGIKKRAGHTTDSPILPSPSVVKLSQMKPIYAADPEDQLPDQDVLEWKSEQQGGGHHDAPNWSKTKSALILCLCTLAFSLIAEVLVDTVDVVISGAGFSEKFLGMTLFALVPSVTEFVNAIAFAIQHNISLALEICNAYTVQVSLLQIPALLFLSSVFIPPSPSSAALSNASTQLRPTFMLQYFVNLIKDPTLSPLDLAYHNLLRPASSSIARSLGSGGFYFQRLSFDPLLLTALAQPLAALYPE
ncbi:putative cation exchanger [Zancudomyces culisetae]|uniref:Putative cation exchanger n=1 Tax=Zancudomyces culisetae TaxID=1213189 RepID=A0A1R1PXW8_ZANCU|nr:putative cation exchanger [Zancudomyces culisetae]|eukprot:OMH85806.1 putative cation exchanger [Zancudomyces culisetae]